MRAQPMMDMLPEVLSEPRALSAWVSAQHAEGRRVAFVPTMGFLHAGHQALIRAAAERGDAVLVSVFVNPTQFGPDEDFERYPRDVEGDLAKAGEAGAHAVFLPTVEAMYPQGHQTRVQVTGLTDELCGAHRPGHFDGVCTVVLKLLNLTRCDVAIFGEKDFQQLAIIRQMVADLDVPVEIVGHPIVREPDGLAMSSRNAYLTPAQRLRALSLSRGLAAAREAFEGGCRDVAAIEAAARAVMEGTEGVEVEYATLRSASGLRAFEGEVDAPAVLALAAQVGATRLIDNTTLTP